MLIWIWKETSATLYLLTLKLTAFFFPLPPSLSWCLSPTEKCSLSHTEFRELFSHFHHQGTLFFIPMRATSHVTSSSRHNFDTSLLNRENSEVTHCRKIRSWLMNELPVIGSLCLRKDFWDRHGANIATRKKGMYSETFRSPKKREIFAFLPLIYQKWVYVILVQ